MCNDYTYKKKDKQTEITSYYICNMYRQKIFKDRKDEIEPITF